jgi:hypothetical protein
MNPDNMTQHIQLYWEGYNPFRSFPGTKRISAQHASCAQYTQNAYLPRMLCIEHTSAWHLSAS